MCILFVFGNATAAEKEGVRFEGYLYEALPVNGDGAQKERGEIAISYTAGNIFYKARIFSSKSSEEIKIETDVEGGFISGIRQVFSSDKGLSMEERVWSEKDKVLVQRLGDGKLNTFNIPADRRFAVDGSLLLLLRFFPFEKDETWKVFMVDFTGYTITVEVRNAGLEIITVPAGIFECYRMEVVVGIPLLHPKIEYWLAKDAPHYLVKNVGKRGPFTDTYVTTLISKQ